MDAELDSVEHFTVSEKLVIVGSDLVTVQSFQEKHSPDVLQVFSCVHCSLPLIFKGSVRDAHGVSSSVCLIQSRPPGGESEGVLLFHHSLCQYCSSCEGCWRHGYTIKHASYAHDGVT